MRDGLTGADEYWSGKALLFRISFSRAEYRIDFGNALACVAAKVVEQAVRQSCSGQNAEVVRHSVCAEFVKMFRPHISSTMNDPSFPSDFIKKSEKEEGEAPTTVPDKLTLNFFLPHETTMKDSKVRELLQLRFQRMSNLYKSAES